MFDFEKLGVYRKIRLQNQQILKFIYQEKKLDPYMKDQLKRATLSIMLNLAEGSGRVSSADKKHFFTIARSSVFECVSILHVLLDLNILSEDNYDEYYSGYEEISKMLLFLFRSNI